MATNVAVNNANNVLEEHKRVSFGGEKQFIVYDEPLLEDSPAVNHVTKYNSPFTPSAAPPSKVTVTSENCEVPRPISPPAQLEELPSALLRGTSPVLPSLAKKMENESTENPFRPEESLYHEVDPIVQAYRQRPFPPSPSNSPTPATHLLNGHGGGGVHNHHTQTTNRYTNADGSTTITTTTYTEYSEGYQTHHNNNTQSTPIGYETTSTTVIDGDAVTPTSRKHREGSRTASLAEGRTAAVDAVDGNALNNADVTLLPPPNKAEVVHIEEKKKKCCRCTII